MKLSHDDAKYLSQSIGTADHITLRKSHTEDLSSQFDFYFHLVDLEFAQCSSYEIYELAFSRLLKQDPFKNLAMTSRAPWPTMLGTDQRDSFVHKLQQLLSNLPAGGQVFDFGAGDGQTVNLVLDSAPSDVIFHLEEPIQNYLDTYTKIVSSSGKGRKTAFVSNLGFQEMRHAFESQELANFPAMGAIDLCLAIHMIYFVGDIRKALNLMIDLLKPGGSLFVVFADGINGFTGKVVQHYHQLMTNGDHSDVKQAEADRLALFGFDGGSRFENPTNALSQALGRVDIAVDCEWKPTRLYGHDLGDLLALGFLTGLADVDQQPTQAKLAAVRSVLESNPESVGLCLDTGGRREGMWSVLQPQVEISITKKS